MDSQLPRPEVPAHVVRSIRSDDAPRLQRFHKRLSADTIRRRFFGAHPTLGDVEARRFTDLNPATDVALVAIAGDRIVGVGRYVRIGTGDCAEVAFVVDDAYQGHGIGTQLLTLLSRIARDDGIRRFVADTFADNAAMIDVFTHTPGAVTVEGITRDGSVIHLSMRVVRPAEIGSVDTRTYPPETQSL
jgi:GNAT superfamily N-acetyltransferase